MAECLSGVISQQKSPIEIGSYLTDTEQKISLRHVVEHGSTSICRLGFHRF